MISERLLARSNDLLNLVRMDRDAVLSLAKSIEELAADVAQMERLIVPTEARRPVPHSGTVISIAEWRAK